jgi:membrane glycosyltransferase
MYAMLLTPKVIGATIIGLHPKAARLYGGRLAFLTAFAVELLLSIAYAPILMVQQTKAVLRSAFGKPGTWTPQNRRGHGYSLRTHLWFHWLETILGGVLVFGLASGLVSLWLLPIAASLILAVPLSLLSGQSVNACLPRALRMNSPHSLREPHILTKAKMARSAMERAVTASKIPAE